MKNWMQAFTTVSLTLGFLALTGYITYTVAPLVPVERLTELLLLIVGALIGSVTTSVQYWMGSSEGSSRKTDVLTARVNSAPSAGTEGLPGGKPSSSSEPPEL